ncbi:pre-mRNA 3'-end-processing factor FIP1 [Acanthochromis polyacanthus]|uniref:pre-mRNA 3'-end-processing factor FIP1 n=1 Tax=Acanthochromis polyacanthus TaxID=80966 RepID=UPI0022341208|nr:pre-mRNA 3'-end-processing factor FIP1 [Acanthochromis polyacanthus]
MSIGEDNREETEQTKITSSSEHTPEHLEMNAEKTHAAGTTEALDIDEPENIKGFQEPNMTIEKTLKKKPWKKPGANISDYFNYGFDEESWNAYCHKQIQIHAINKELHAKFMAQKRHTGLGEDESSSGYTHSDRPSKPASRDPHAAAAAKTGGQPRSRNRKKKHRCPNNTQVDTKMSHKEDSITAYHLPPPPNISSPFAYVSPPSFLFQSRPPPSSSTIFDSAHPNDFDGPSTSLSAHSSGRIFTRAGVIDTTRAWEYYTRQLKCDRHKDRSRERGHDKKSKRGRAREKERRASSHNRVPLQ